MGDRKSHILASVPRRLHGWVLGRVNDIVVRDVKAVRAAERLDRGVLSEVQLLMGNPEAISHDQYL